MVMGMTHKARQHHDDARLGDEQLQPLTADWSDQEHASSDDDNMKLSTQRNDESADGVVVEVAPTSEQPPAYEDFDGQGRLIEYRVYRQRWFGLIQLSLLNIIVSWDWLSFAPVSDISASYFSVSETAINWLSTAFLFAFCVSSPAVIWTLNKGGPKPAIIVASVLILAGNWIRYAGTRSGPNGHFGVVMLGQILIGLAQPFVLSAPTRYSDLWFTDQGRISATALASLANPFGGALGHLIDPFLATKAKHIPNMVFFSIDSILKTQSSISTLPSFFLASAPPTPPSASSLTPKPPLKAAVRTLLRSADFYLIFIPFATYVTLFNTLSTILAQTLTPYNYSAQTAGIIGGLLILTGLVSAAITSPLVDHYKSHLLAIKLLVPLLGLTYILFPIAPPTRTLAAPLTLSCALGAASFSLVPVALEWLAESTYPLSPEAGSTLCWAGGQFGGAVLVIAMDALKGVGGRPKGNMQAALWFMGALAIVVVPVPVFGLGKWGTRGKGRRWEIERSSRGAGGSRSSSSGASGSRRGRAGASGINHVDDGEDRGV
ncbi:MAG: hypothetical protein M1819_005555 [Sarea resinae]|nr:MAG: hypothetical protein M1819_005555 [Sarea resinae]